MKEGVGREKGNDRGEGHEQRGVGLQHPTKPDGAIISHLRWGTRVREYPETRFQVAVGSAFWCSVLPVNAPVISLLNGRLNLQADSRHVHQSLSDLIPCISLALVLTLLAVATPGMSHSNYKHKTLGGSRIEQTVSASYLDSILVSSAPGNPMPMKTETVEKRNHVAKSYLVFSGETKLIIMARYQIDSENLSPH